MPGRDVTADAAHILWLASLRAVVVFIALAVIPAAEAQQNILNRREALSQVQHMGLLTDGEVETPEGRTSFSLQHIVNGVPLYYQTTNANAAMSVSTDKCYPAGMGGLSLTGFGVTLGIWDAGAVRAGHVEFGGRATQRDHVVATNYHSTHVAGTMIGLGAAPSAKGMSPEAFLDCYDWNNDQAEMNAAAQLGLRVSNHSYGLITGWQRTSFVPTESNGDIDPVPIVSWTWFGDTRVSATEDYFFGYYSFEARAWDQIAVNNPFYLFVKSAGNDRNQGPSPGTAHLVFDFSSGQYVVSTATRSLDGNGGFDCISHSGTCKNGLTVGAVNDVLGGYTTPSRVAMSSFSCWGPTDDGRIKPDLVGNGVQLYSSTDTGNQAYEVLSGTSMAAPNVSGSLGLLIQHFRETHPGDQDMLASTLKGLVIATADECGTSPGPDYQYGWGILNTLKAAQLITADVSNPLVISEHVLDQNGEFELFITSDPAAPQVRATICWTDPVPLFELPPALDPVQKILVNDLDLTLTAGGEVHMPWVLDGFSPSLPASTGDNITDNVEQVVIGNVGENAYRLKVSHKGDLTGGSQIFSLIIQGAAAISEQPERIPPQVAAIEPADGSLVGAIDVIKVTFSEPVVEVRPDNLMIHGVAAESVVGHGAGPYSFTGQWTPPDGQVDVQLVAGEIKDIFDNNLVGASWQYEKHDCNGNRILDETDVALHTSEDCNLNFIPDECDPDVLKVGPYVARAIEFGEVVSLHASDMISGGVPPFTFEWTLRGSAGEMRSTVDSPQFRPREPGTFVARLVATDAMGCRVIGFVTVDVSNATQSPEVGLAPAPTVTGGFCPMSFGLTLVTLLLGIVGRWAFPTRVRQLIRQAAKP